MTATHTKLARIFAVILIGFIMTPLSSSPEVKLKSSQEVGQNPNISLVASNEFYAEQIAASVYGDASLLTHLLITNDSNIFQRLDFTDPAFLDASVLISASNGISSPIDPNIYTPEESQTTSGLGANAFFGFLYYNNQTNPNEIQDRSPRAFKILKEAFQMDLIQYDTGSDRFFPFVGYYPIWDVYQDVLFSGVPKDGYFGAIDYDRISSASYLSTKMFSGSLVLFDKVTVLNEIADVAGDYYGVNLDDYFNIASFDLGQYDLSALGQAFEDIPFFNATGIATLMSSLGGLTSILGSGGLTDLLQYSRILSMVVRYEGHPNGIVKNLDDTFTFDLFKALNYNGTQLNPSKSIYVALMGALFSAVTINLFSSEVADFTPKRCDFSTYLVERIELASFIAGQDIDLSLLTDYSFRTYWETSGGQSLLYSNLYNPTNDQDIMNSLYTLGIKGTLGIPLGLLNPLSSLWVKYSIPNAELLLDVKKNIDTGYNSVTGLSTMTVNVKNVGNRTAWGVIADRPFLSPETVLGPIQDYIPGLYNYLFGEDGSGGLARSQFDQDAEEFLGMKDARNFLLDTSGDGAYDSYYPNPYSTTGLLPYNPVFARWLIDYGADDDLFSVLGIDGRQYLANLFNDSGSIFNPENYQLQPGEGFSYVSNNTASIINTYTSFEEYNYSQGSFPALVYGQTADGTTPAGGLAANDVLAWNITSEQAGVQHLIQCIFKFQNTTIPNPLKELDQLRLVWQGINNISLAGDIQWAIWNRTTGGSGAFQDFTWNTDNTNPTTVLTYNFNTGLSDLTDGTNNYTTYVRLTIVTDAPVKLSIDDFNLNFTMLDTNALDLGSARVTYSTSASYNRLTVASNGALITTRDAPSLVGQAELTQQRSYPGDLNMYTLHLTNNGTETARNITISMTTPGIIIDPGNFTLIGNMLNCSLEDLPATASFINISFTFRTPNSLLVPKARIEYDNFIDLLPNEADFVTSANQIFLSAPIDYDTRVPYLNLLGYTLSTNVTAPAIGEHINVTLIVQNIGQETIPEINLTWGQNLDGFSFLSANTFKITDLQPGVGNEQEISFILNKTNYRGYFVPPIIAVNGTQFQTIRQIAASPIILGASSLRITRTSSNLQPETNDVVTITVTVENNGTIDMEQILVNDINCFPQQGYTLNSGVLVFNITKLIPGQSVSFSYTIKAKNQGHYEFRPAEVTYFYVYKVSFTSPTLSSKVQSPPYILMLYFAIPLVIGIVAIIIYYSMQKKIQKEDYELRRREELMFGKEGTQVAWHKKNLTQVLDDIKEGGG